MAPLRFPRYHFNGPSQVSKISLQWPLFQDVEHFQAYMKLMFHNTAFQLCCVEAILHVTRLCFRSKDQYYIMISIYIQYRHESQYLIRIRDLPNNFFNNGPNSNAMQSQCSIWLKVKTNEDLLISVLINQFTLHFLKFNDGTSDFNNGVDNLMMEHFNLTMEQLHHKIP